MRESDVPKKYNIPRYSPVKSREHTHTQISTQSGSDCGPISIILTSPLSSTGAPFVAHTHAQSITHPGTLCCPVCVCVSHKDHSIIIIIIGVRICSRLPYEINTRYCRCDDSRHRSRCAPGRDLPGDACASVCVCRVSRRHASD